jgi:L-rhamnose-H+ transport protein
MFNFALIAGKPLESQAMEFGASTVNAPNVTWCIALFGGFLTTLAYCLCLNGRNRTWRCYTAAGSQANWLWTFLMGLMWFTGVALFGMAVTQLGPFGPSIGWPLIQSAAVVSGNFWGFATGEWRGSGRTPVLVMTAGLLLLVTGIVLIGWSSTLQAQRT